MSIKIITDSTSDLSLERASHLGVEMICLKVTIDGATYQDKIELSNEEFYEKLAKCKEIPITSLVSPQEFEDVFKKYPDDDIIGIFVSSKLSGTFQSAMIAKEGLGRDNIYLVDSGSVACGLAVLVEHAVKMRDRGAGTEEIYKTVLEFAEKVEIYAAVDTLKYLVKGGRLTGIAGAFGTILKIKPILKVKNGEIVNIGKEKGMVNAIERLISIVTSINADSNAGYYGGHTNNIEDLMILMKKLNIEQSPVCSIGSVVGTHAGPKAVAIALVNSDA